MLSERILSLGRISQSLLIPWDFQFMNSWPISYGGKSGGFMFKPHCNYMLYNTHSDWYPDDNELPWDHVVNQVCYCDSQQLSYLQSLNWEQAPYSMEPSKELNAA